MKKNKAKRDNFKLAVLVIGVLLIVGITFAVIQIANLSSQISGFASKNPCSDSDGGQNVIEQGIATDSSGSTTDYCIDDLTLREYYCGNNVNYKDLDCSEYNGRVCSDGACVYE